MPRLVMTAQVERGSPSLQYSETLAYQMSLQDARRLLQELRQTIRQAERS